MSKIDEIKKYITDNPGRQARKIAKEFKIPVSEAEKLRNYVLRQESELAFDKPKTVIDFERQEKKNEIIIKINKILNHPLLSGRMLYINLFLLAFLVRIIYFYFLNKHPELKIPLIDAEYYLEWAKRILTEGIIGNKVFFTEPAYAYLLALFLKLKWPAESVMLGLQVFLNSLLPIVVYKIGEKVFNRPIALGSALIMAAYGPLVFYDYLLLKTSLETFFLAVFILFLIKLLDTKNIKIFLIGGILLGLITSLKGNAMILAPVFALFVFVLFKLDIKTKLKIIGLFFAGFLIAISPMTLHNYLAGHDFVPTNYSSGIVLYGGNWWDGDGSILAPPFVRPVPLYEETDMYKMAEAYMGKSLKPSQVSSFWSNKAIAEAIQGPEHWTYTTVKKFFLLITRVELSDNYDYAFYAKSIPILKILPGFWLVVSLALTGILLLLFSKDAKKALGNMAALKMETKLLLAILGGYAGLVVIGTVNARYRIPLMPFFILIAVFTIWFLVNRIIYKDYVKVSLIVISLCICLFLTSVHLDNFDSMTDANFYNTLGSYYQDQKDDVRAEKYYKTANEIDKKFPWGYANLANLYLKHGELVLADDLNKEKIKLRPDDLSGYATLKLIQDLKGKSTDFIKNRLANEALKTEEKDLSGYDPDFYEYMRAFRYQDYKKAEKYLSNSLKKFNSPPATRLHMAMLKKATGDVEGAKEILSQLARTKPELLVAKYNLANIYIKKKNYSEVAKLLQAVVDEIPEYGNGEALYYLAAAYINTKNFNAALPVVQDYIKRFENDPSKKQRVDDFKSRLVPAKN